MGGPASRIRETDLYPPLKRMLEAQGYVVKGEVGDADLVAIREPYEDPVLVELKARFSLSLFHQAVRRQAISDAVYVAVPRLAGRAFARALADNKALCRRLGLGLVTVRLRDGHVEIHCDPAPYRPRQSKPRRSRLLGEFLRRVGDPNHGGATRIGLVTAYRQDALRCLALLETAGPTKAAEVARLTGVPQARRLMADDHYGWFERLGRGIYAPSPKGIAAVLEYGEEIGRIREAAAVVPAADVRREASR